MKFTGQKVKLNFERLLRTAFVGGNNLWVNTDFGILKKHKNKKQKQNKNQNNAPKPLATDFNLKLRSRHISMAELHFKSKTLKRGITALIHHGAEATYFEWKAAEDVVLRNKIAMQNGFLGNCVLDC